MLAASSASESLGGRGRVSPSEQPARETARYRDPHRAILGHSTG